MMFALQTRLALLVVLVLYVGHAQNSQPGPRQAIPDAAASPAPAVSPTPPDSTQLELLSGPQPDYPLEAAAKGIQGKVTLQLHISEQGDVSSTEILEGDPLLAKSAEEAMKKWKFKPFIKDGVAVNVSRKVPWDFVLHGSGCWAAVEAALRANLEHHRETGTLIAAGVAEGKLTHRVEPTYPLIARMKRIQGDVFLQAKIGEDGRIVELKALCGPPELIPSSLDAVKHWRYSPFLLNGVPTEAQTTITVRFRM